MKVCSFDIQRRHLFIGDFLTDGILIYVYRTIDGQAGSSASGRNQLQDDRKTHQRCSAPVLCDRREQSMLDLIPFTGAGRKVMHGDRQAAFICPPLQLPFPQSMAGSVASATVRRNVQVGRRRIGHLAITLPPGANRLYRKFRGIMVDTHTNPSGIVREIIDTIWRGAPHSGSTKS